MFTRPDRFQKGMSLEVDKWGHGVRIRALDNDTGERTRSIFLDQGATIALAQKLAEYTGLINGEADRQRRALALLALRDAIDALTG